MLIIRLPAGFLLALYWALTSKHYYKVVKNQYFKYPKEWFPSISAVIGDWHPERTFFHYCMAGAAGELSLHTDLI